MDDSVTFSVTPRERALLGDDIEVLSRSKNMVLYRLCAGSGQGTMLCYHLFPGVDLIFNDFDSDTCFQAVDSQPDYLKINYCHKGRFACQFASDRYAYLCEYEMAVNRLSLVANNSVFPTGHYEGFTIMVDMERTQVSMDTLFPHLEIEIKTWCDRVCSYDECRLYAPENELLHTLTSFYTVDPKLRPCVYQLKVLELFKILQVIDLPVYTSTTYLTRRQTDQIRHIHDHLSENLDQTLTLRDLCEEHGIGLTLLKERFMTAYGIAPMAYRKQCRMRKAAVLLATTKRISLILPELWGMETPVSSLLHSAPSLM